jgi:WD40 repeat protein
MTHGNVLQYHMYQVHSSIRTGIGKAFSDESHENARNQRRSAVVHRMPSRPSIEYNRLLQRTLLPNLVYLDDHLNEVAMTILRSFSSNKVGKLHVALLLLGCVSDSESLLQQTATSKISTKLLDSNSPFYDDFEDFTLPPNSDNMGDDDLFDALRRRQDSIQLSASPQPTASEEYLSNWRNANCASTVRLSLDDWIRRMAIDTYPLAVLGSASGHVYLADLERGKELDCMQNVHVPGIEIDDSRYTLQFQNAIDALYGKHDGGGVLAIAIKGDLIASSGREGGVHISTIAGEEEDSYKGSRGGTARETKLSLKREGTLRGLEAAASTLITSLVFDDAGTLWMGGYDGVLRGYDSKKMDAENRPMMLRQKKPIHESNLNSPILSVSVNNDLGCGVGTTRDHGVFIFSLEDGQILSTWKPFGRRDEFFRTAIIVQNDVEPESAWSVVCGGSKGSMFQRRLNIDSMTGFVSDDCPFEHLAEHEHPMKLRPSHARFIVALTSPAPGLLVSGAQDGHVRVWDCSYHRGNNDDEESEDEGEAQYDDVGGNESRPRCLYAMTGYKVWLGSIFADGKKLASDGADNTIIVHSFDGEEDVMFREDDDEEGGLAFE